jgi:hypothetical protein
MKARMIFPGAIVNALLPVIQSENLFKSSNSKKDHPLDILFPATDDLYNWWLHNESR